KIDRFYPWSKTCHVCGWINQNLNLSIRQWICRNGHQLERNPNASINILKEGLKIHAKGLAITKVEDNSDYSGSTSDETRSPSIAFA
ncbi:MAG TPA: zinc ribbon domain-containing protein, partial [Salinimicrobium sp.]|nr:zinc ribbon domain-containing protein [Salinimicrobium sp.]